MTNTPAYVLHVRVLTDIPADMDTIAQLGRQLGDTLGALVSMISLDNGREIGITYACGALPDLHPTGQPRALAVDALDQLAAAVRATGREVLEVTTLEVQSRREAERRAAQPSIPPMVDAEQFAELAAVTPQRIYQLTHERRTGKRTDFPPEVVPGYWLRTSAAAFAARPRRTGRPPKTETDKRHAD